MDLASVKGRKAYALYMEDVLRRTEAIRDEYEEEMEEARRRATLMTAQRAAERRMPLRVPAVSTTEQAMSPTAGIVSACVAKSLVRVMALVWMFRSLWSAYSAAFKHNAWSDDKLPHSVRGGGACENGIATV